MGLHLENEVAVVKTPTVILNNPVFVYTYSCKGSIDQNPCKANNVPVDKNSLHFMDPDSSLMNSQNNATCSVLSQNNPAHRSH